jgi:tetratricopeptide (TPR) repeat protein
VAKPRALVVALAVAALGGGCATTSGVHTQSDRWISEAKAQGLDLQNPLILTNDVRNRVHELVGYDGSEKARLMKLVRFVSDSPPDGLAFRYQTQQSLTAEQAYFARQGDCMSYANLFVALARLLDAEVRFVRITQLPVTWEAGGRFFESSHMAVAHGRETAWDRSLLVDFGNVHSAPWRFALYDDVSDEEAFVLFQNNVAVEKMLAGDVNAAERMLRFLRDHAPAVPEVHNNLALVLLQTGRAPEALTVLQEAVEKFPNFRPLYSNAVQAARRVGNEQLALALESKGKELLEDEPSWNFNEGMRSYQDRAYSAAAMRFEKALTADPDNVRLLAWSARAHLAAGDLRRGLEQVERIRGRPTSETRDSLLRDLGKEFPQIDVPGGAVLNVARPVASRAPTP